MIWLKLSQSYKRIGFFFMLAMLLFGFPSPILVYASLIKS